MLTRLATIRQIVVLLATAIAFTVTGCGDDDEPVAPTPEKTAAPSSEKTAATPPAAPTGEPGRVLIPKRKAPDGAPKQTLLDEINTEIPRPDNFPSDAPVYPGSKTNNSTQLENALMVTFSTSDDPAQVSSHMATELESAGWENVRAEEMPSGEGSMVTGTKPNRSISILTAPLDAGTGDAVTVIMMRIEG